MDTFGLRAASEAAASVATILSERVRLISLHARAHDADLLRSSWNGLGEEQEPSHPVVQGSAVATGPAEAHSTSPPSSGQEARHTSVQATWGSLVALPP